MNKSNINELSAQTEADSDSPAQNQQVSQPNANTNVVGSLLGQREIKFRGQDKYGVWVYGSLVNNLWETNKEKQPICEIITAGRNYYDCWQDMVDNENIVEVKSETVGLYTGIKDKNSKEIYEGDIIRGFSKYLNEFQNKQVVYEVSGWALTPKIGITFTSQIEVIGNVFENPELLQSVA